MLNFVRDLIFILNFMGVVCSLAVMLKSRVITAEAFEASYTQIKAMRWSVFALVILFWFVATGSIHTECLARYAELSKICMLIGGGWLSFSLIASVLSFVSAIISDGNHVLKKLSSLRFSGFWIGLLYLFISYILRVS